jgi:hypothetical protein
MHKCLAVCTGGSGHGHTQAVLGVREDVHNWAVFYVRVGDVSREFEKSVFANGKLQPLFFAESESGAP